MELNYIDIGLRIRNERVRQNISQQKLAEMADLSITHTSHIETGNTKVSLPSLIKIVNALNITMNDLLCDSITKAKEVFENEITRELQDCDEKEIRVIAESIRTIKNSLRKVYSLRSNE